MGVGTICHNTKRVLRKHTNRTRRAFFFKKEKSMSNQNKNCESIKYCFFCGKYKTKGNMIKNMIFGQVFKCEECAYKRP